MKTVLLVVVCLAQLGAQSAAPKQKTGPAGPQRRPFPDHPEFTFPEPPPQLDRFKKLIGTWDTKEHWEVLAGFSPGGEGTGVETFTEGAGGQSVMIDYKTLTGVFPGYTGHGVISWELYERMYRMAFVQSVYPGVSIENGKIEGDTLTLSYEIFEFGEKYTVNNIYTDWKPDYFKVTTWFVKTNGNPAKSVTIELTRRK